MVEGRGWLGTRTDRYHELNDFYRDVMGLTLHHEEPDFAVFKLPDGSAVEVFGPSDEQHTHFATGPVVDDIDKARARLEAGGAKFIGPVHRWEPTNEAWSHFRAPDGNVYELTQPSQATPQT